MTFSTPSRFFRRIHFLTLAAWLTLSVPCLTQGQGSSMMPSDGRQAASSSKNGDSPGIKDLFSSIGRSATEALREWLGVRRQKEESWNSAQSPRHTFFTFVNGMDALLRTSEGDPKRVEQTLPDGFSAQDQEVLALKKVLDRFAPVDPVKIPDTSGDHESNSPSRFEVFPYALNHRELWEKLDSPPTGEIHLVRKGENTWIFSTATLQGAEKLLEEVRALPPIYPEHPHRNLLKSVFEPMLRETPWWGWAILGASLMIAVSVGIYVRRGVMRLGKWLEAQTRPLVGTILKSIGVSLGILAGTVVFVLGGSFVHFSELFSSMYWELIQGILLIAFVWAILGFTDLVTTVVKTRVMNDHNEYGAMTITLVQRITNTLLFTILAIFLLENVFSMNIGALVTGLGIIGLALSLAGKESAQNLFGAITIFVNRPFVVGDWISFRGKLGEVVDVRMQATFIRLLSGEMLIAPNMLFVSNEVENLGMRQFLRREMNIALPYGTPPKNVTRAIDVLKDVLKQEKIVKEGNFDLEERPASVTFSDFGDYYLNIKVYYWYRIGEEGNKMQRNDERGWFTYLEHSTLVNQAILEAFDREHIEFAFPTQTIELEKKPESVRDEE